MLQIDINGGTVEALDDIELPKTGDFLWASGARAADNNIYYMPYSARRIMKLNPNNDSLSSVGDDLGREDFKYVGTVIGNDDCLCGISDEATRIVKFDPANPDTTSTVGEEAEEMCRCGNGVLAGYGNIYSLNIYGQVLQIDTKNSDYTWIGDRICLPWIQVRGDPIVGVDKCIYWPPSDGVANRVLKFDPETQQLPSLVGGFVSYFTLLK
jgi:hypothetical protein